MGTIKETSRVTVGSRLLLRYQPTQNGGKPFDVSAATVRFYLRDPSGNISTLAPSWNSTFNEWQYRLAESDLDETNLIVAGTITAWAVGLKTTESPVNAPTEWFPLYVYKAAGT